MAEIGKRLHVSRKDIADVKGNYWKDYFLYIGAGILLAAIFFVLGCPNGGNNAVNNAVTHVNHGYPYGLVLPGVAARRKGRIAAGLLGIAAFLLLLSVPVFGNSILYNVFSRKK